MKRYIRIYLRLLQLNFSVLITNRVGNFIAGIIGTVGWGIASIISMFLLTVRTSTSFGWTRNEMLLMTGLYGGFIGIYHMFFSRNFERFSRIIHLGQLDGVLLKPLDSQFYLSLWLFNYLGMLRTLLGIGFAYFMIHVLGLQVNYFDFFLFLLFFAAGLLIVYSLWYIVVTITIWFSNLSNITDFLYNFTSIARYPREAITQVGNAALFIFIPLVFVISVPAKTLLHKVTFLDIVGLFFFATGLFIISRHFWHFALRYYTSASG